MQFQPLMALVSMNDVHTPGFVIEEKITELQAGN